MEIGDLVKYRHRDRDIGIIMEVEEDSKELLMRVVWIKPRIIGVGRDPHFTDWVRPRGLEVINASR